VRAIGEELGLPEEIVWRQPFPGPGLAVRIIGRSRRSGWRSCAGRTQSSSRRSRSRPHKEVWQAFAVLPAVRSVGVMGDERTYAYPIIVRAVTSDDAMTADWARLPYDVLERLSSRIINEVPVSTASRSTSLRSHPAPSMGVAALPFAFRARLRSGTRTSRDTESIARGPASRRARLRSGTRTSRRH